MRFYIKLLLIVGVFCFLASEPGKRIAGDLAYDVRVGLVCAFGDDAAFEALVRDTQRMLAARSGALDS